MPSRKTIIVGIIALLPLILFGADIAAGLAKVIVTGTCGPYAPDIPAYPCTPEQFLTGGSAFENFGRIVVLVLCVVWFTIVMMIAGIVHRITARHRSTD